MKKSKNYRLSDKALATISFLMEKKWGKDATHVIECALAGAEAMWHIRQNLNEDTKAIQAVEIKINEAEQKMISARAPLLRPNGKL